MKVLKPSSIHACRRSSVFTTIGNQLWPNSCVVTPHSPRGSVRPPQYDTIGYSIPPTIPLTFVAVGYGYAYHIRE